MNWGKYLTYNPETGEFLWKHRPDARPQWNGRYAGKRAGSVSARKDRHIVFRPFTIKEHRLAYWFMTGVMPSGQIDHINNNPADNRWSNLRLATESQQKQNTKRRLDNKSGFKGVSWSTQKGKYVARINVNGKAIHLGSFENPKDGHKKYVEAAIIYFGEFSNAG